MLCAKIEHNYCKGERSLNRTSTASMVDVGSFSLNSITTSPPHVAPHHGAQAPRCPSPPLRDVGPENIRTSWEGEGATKGGPSGQCVTRTSHDFCLGSFSPFPCPPPSPAPLTSDSRSGLNHDVADHTTTQIAEGRDGTVPQPKAQRAKQHHERLRDDMAGQKMGRRGDSGCEGRNEPTSTIDAADVGFKLHSHGQ